MECKMGFMKNYTFNCAAKNVTIVKVEKLTK
jgi:hypothetical protein